MSRQGSQQMTTAAHIAKQLKKAIKKADGSYMCTCPAHADRTPSLSLADGELGLVYHCYAGCPPASVRAGLERETDLQPHQQTEYEPLGIAFPTSYCSPRKHIYRDADGMALYVIDRQPTPTGKTFKQAHISGDGTLTPGMNGVIRVPYNLHHFAATDTIILVEGEQAVEALNRKGYIATTNPGGAGNWKEELNPYFKGKHVVIIPENDNPGREHAKKVTSALEATAATVITADICSTLNDKDDIVQWLQKNHTKDLWKALAPYRSNPNDESVSAWLQKDMPPRDYLMGTLLCTTSRWMIYAPTGLGKTLFTMNLSAAMAAGKAFLHWGQCRPARLLYIDGEMPAETFKERIVQVAALYGDDINLFGLNRDSLQSKGEDIPPLNTDDGIAWLEAKIALYQPDVIVFDSIMCLLTGDMKDEESWEPIKQLIKRLSNQHIAQIWVHHTGHAEGRSYGSNTREWELDTVLRLDRPKDGSDGFVLNFTKCRLRTPANAAEFEPKQCNLTEDGWDTSAPENDQKGKGGDDRTSYRDSIIQAYDNLAIGRQEERGHDGCDVVAVPMNMVREWCIDHGVIPAKEGSDHVLEPDTRRVFNRAKTDLIKGRKFAGNGTAIWRIK